MFTFLVANPVKLKPLNLAHLLVNGQSRVASLESLHPKGRASKSMGGDEVKVILV